MNRAVLAGRITADPEVKKTQSGLSVCSFTLAVSGNSKDAVDWISCTVWRQGADFLGQYAKKGDLIGVDGRISTRSYEKDGQKIKVTEVTTDKVYILAHKGQNQQNGNSSAEPVNGSQNQQNGFTQQSMTNEWSVPAEISEDDLPF